MTHTARHASLIRIYLDNIGSTSNRAASCLFVKDLALLLYWRQLLETSSSIFPLLPNFGYSLNNVNCLSCSTLSPIRQYLGNIMSKCNRADSYLFIKELAPFRCGTPLLEIISSFFSSSMFGFSFCSL